MFADILPAPSRRLLTALVESDILKPFYLAGGTGAALQLGHRLSADLDFFTADSFSVDRLVQGLAKTGELKVSQQDEGTLTGVLAGVKLSFLAYPYPLLEPAQVFEGAELAGLIDIGLMKLTAIAGRGARRDFIDVFYICAASGGLNNLLAQMTRKFSGVIYSQAHLLRSLTYFSDADKEPQPRMLGDVDWSEVKRFFEQESAGLALDKLEPK